MKQFAEFLKESYLSRNASSELAKAESALVAHREIPKASRAADHRIRMETDRQTERVGIL